MTPAPLPISLPFPPPACAVKLLYSLKTSSSSSWAEKAWRRTVSTKIKHRQREANDASTLAGAERDGCEANGGPPGRRGLGRNAHPPPLLPGGTAAGRRPPLRLPSLPLAPIRVIVVVRLRLLLLIMDFPGGARVREREGGEHRIRRRAKSQVERDETGQKQWEKKRAAGKARGAAREGWQGGRTALPFAAGFFPLAAADLRRFARGASESLSASLSSSDSSFFPFPFPPDCKEYGEAKARRLVRSDHCRVTQQGWYGDTRLEACVKGAL